MFRIKKSQMAAFDEASLEDFEDDTVVHVKTHFPNHDRILGESRIRKVIRYGIRRAHHHGLTTERSMCLYVTLMLMLGSNFDVDLQLPWAATILSDDALKPQSARVDRLTETAMEHLDRVAGTDNLHLNRALFRMRRGLPRIAAQPLVEGVGFSESMLIHFGDLFPRKYDTVGEHHVRLALQHGMGTAGRYGLTTDRDLAVYTSFVFVLGTAFDGDPQLTAITDVLTEDAAIDPRPKADRLCEKAMSFLEMWLPQV